MMVDTAQVLLVMVDTAQAFHVMDTAQTFLVVLLAVVGRFVQLAAGCTEPVEFDVLMNVELLQ